MSNPHLAAAVRLANLPDYVLDVAGDFLASRPIVHNLILTLLHARVRQPGPGRYWVVFDEVDRPVGVVLQSPLDFPATLTPMPDAAVAAAVSSIVEAGVDLPGVNGEAATAARFAGQWSERRAVPVVPFNGQRLYALEQLVMPVGVPGRLRLAEPHELPLICDWQAGFDRDTGERSVGNVALDTRVAAGQVWLWDDQADGGPRSVAIHTDPVAGLSRIQFVYTPPEHRGRGYASACVAGLSAWLVGRGLGCVLYTDLANPVSNSIYRRIGYRAVIECLRYNFGEQPPRAHLPDD